MNTSKLKTVVTSLKSATPKYKVTFGAMIQSHGRDDFGSADVFVDGIRIGEIIKEVSTRHVGVSKIPYASAYEVNIDLGNDLDDHTKYFAIPALRSHPQSRDVVLEVFKQAKDYVRMMVSEHYVPNEDRIARQTISLKSPEKLLQDIRKYATVAGRVAGHDDALAAKAQGSDGSDLRSNPFDSGRWDFKKVMKDVLKKSNGLGKKVDPAIEQEIRTLFEQTYASIIDRMFPA